MHACVYTCQCVTHSPASSSQYNSINRKKYPGTHLKDIKKKNSLRQGVSLLPGALLPAPASIKHPAIVVAQSVAEHTAGMLPASLHGSHILVRVRARPVYFRRVLRVVQVAGVALAVERVGTAAVLRTAVHVHAKMGSDENERLPRLQPEGFVVLQQQHAGSACVAVPMNAPAYRQIHVHSIAHQCI